MAHAFTRWLAAAGVSLALCSNAAAQWYTPPNGSFSVPPGGTVDLACTTLDMQGTLELNGGLLTSDSSASFGAGASVTGSGGTISVGGNLDISGALTLSGNSLELRDGCDSGNTTVLSGTLVVQNLTIRTGTNRLFILPDGANITVLGTLRIQGVGGLPARLEAASGTAVITLAPGANLVRSNASIPPTVQINQTASTIAPIPTLGQYGLIALSLLMGLAFWRQRRPARA